MDVESTNSDTIEAMYTHLPADLLITKLLHECCISLNQLCTVCLGKKRQKSTVILRRPLFPIKSTLLCGRKVTPNSIKKSKSFKTSQITCRYRLIDALKSEIYVFNSLFGIHNQYRMLLMCI